MAGKISFKRGSAKPRKDEHDQSIGSLINDHKAIAEAYEGNQESNLQN